MIRYLQGNLLRAEAEALVNTVNTVGVMGKGIALQFKEMFPENFTRYAQAVKDNEIRTGQMFVFLENTIEGPKWIINFPTKQQWFAPSRYNWIEEGLVHLVEIIQEKKIKSIAIPPLGCGNGKLDWSKVKGMMEAKLGVLEEVDVQIFTPNEKVREILAAENKPQKAKLTTARAELLYLLFHFEASGEESSLFIANKLAYFLQRLGDKQLKLQFQKHHYGPYSNQVDHLMYALNGTFIDGLEQRTAKPFERLQLKYSCLSEVQDYVKTQLSPEQQSRLSLLLQMIDGFQSPLSMEALASVDAILQEDPFADEEMVFNKISNWNDRKKQLFSQHHIHVALKRINKFRKELGYQLP